MRTSWGPASTAASSCSEARAPTSAAKRRRCWNRWKGKRPMPRSRPPFPAVEGLYRRPTCVNNAETLSNVPHILRHGQEWYNTIGIAPRNTGPKIFCVSGRVNKPGNYELPLGSVTFRELIEHYAGGVIGGREIKGVLPAGISAPIATGAQLDAKLDYDSVAAAGTDARVCQLDRPGRDGPDPLGRRADGRVLPQGVVREVHPLPRGHPVAPQGAGAHPERRGPRGRPGSAALASQARSAARCSAPSATSRPAR